MRNVLERLGQPEDIVAAEASAPGANAIAPSAALVHPSLGSPSRWGATEILAIGLLTVGAILLPFFGPAIGLVLVWLSTRWRTRDKVVATGIVVVLFVLPIVGLLVASGAPGGVVVSTPEVVP